MKKYVEAIQSSKEENEKSLAPARAAEQKGVLGLEIAKLKVSIQTEHNALAEMCSQYPLPIDEVLEAQDALALDQRRLSQLQHLESELFGS